MSRSSTATATACAAAFLLVVTGCGNSDTNGAGPQLVRPGKGNEVTVGLSDVKPHDQVSFGGMIVCLDRKGSITITDVEPWHPQGGIQVEEFGVRPSPFWTHEAHGAGIGVLSGDLADNHFKAGRIVPVTCDRKTGRGYELAVSTTMPDDAPASMRGVRVDYLSNGKKQSLNYPLTMVLCPKGQDYDSCKPGST